MRIRKINRRVITILLTVFVVTFALGSVVGKQLKLNYFEPSVEDKISRGKPVNILFMGIDARSAHENSRSDTMILASIDKKSKKVVMVWIPRDTRVEVGRGRYAKINSVNFTKGPEAACQTVGKLLNTKVNYYVVTNFRGFEKIVDILGGVDIDVEMNMYHPDPDPRLSINLKKGPQHLNGADALRYVRFRGGPTADIGRTARQQKFITALAREMFKTSTILKLPQLVPELAENVDTNIPMSDMVYMVKLAKNFDAGSIATQTLPGYPFTDPKTGASYWEADREIANGILDDLFQGKKYDVAQDPPNWVTPPARPVTNQMLEEEVPPETLEESEEENLSDSEKQSPEGTDGVETDPTGPEGYLPGEGTTTPGTESGSNSPGGQGVGVPATPDGSPGDVSGEQPTAGLLEGSANLVQ
ncbi:LCP family protein [Syntrophomonas erecta]